MKLFTKKDKRTDFEKAIEEQIEDLRSKATTPEEVQKVMELSERLHKKKFMISPDTLVVVLGNLLGIGLILSYEHIHVITSKALGFVLKGRL